MVKPGTDGGMAADGGLASGMRLEFLPVDSRLTTHVERLWVVESPGYLPEDIRTVVPNGRAKIVFPYRGTLRSGPLGFPHHPCPAGSLWLLGPSNRPSTVDADGAFGVVSLEFRRESACRFVPFPLRNLLNRVMRFDEAFGESGTRLEKGLGREADPVRVAERIQEFLVGMLDRLPPLHPVVAPAIAFLEARGGLASVQELSRHLGYSSRHVSALFERHVGLRPKELCEVLRFQNRLHGNEAVEGYFDQAHATREFKRFSGLAPGRYAKATKEFLDRLGPGSSDFYKRPDGSAP